MVSCDVLGERYPSGSMVCHSLMEQGCLVVVIQIACHLERIVYIILAVVECRGGTHYVDEVCETMLRVVDRTRFTPAAGFLAYAVLTNHE